MCHFLALLYVLLCIRVIHSLKFYIFLKKLEGLATEELILVRMRNIPMKPRGRGRSNVT